MRAAATSSSSAGHGATPMEIDRVRARARTRRKGKEKARARSSRDGATTAGNGVTKLQVVGMEKRNRCTKYKVQLVRPA